MNMKEFEHWLKERDEAAQTFDVEAFKRFYRKWQHRGYYTKTLPADEVIEIAMRKMVCAMTKADPAKVEEAKAWLKERGHTEL